MFQAEYHGQKVVVKVIDMKQLKEEEKGESKYHHLFEMELFSSIRFLKDKEHAHIVPCYEVMGTENHVYFVFEREAHHLEKWLKWLEIV